jgi:hypothetical protein
MDIKNIYDSVTGPCARESEMGDRRSSHELGIRADCCRQMGCPDGFRYGEEKFFSAFQTDEVDSPAPPIESLITEVTEPQFHHCCMMLSLGTIFQFSRNKMI